MQYKYLILLLLLLISLCIHLFPCNNPRVQEIMLDEQRETGRIPRTIECELFADLGQWYLISITKFPALSINHQNYQSSLHVSIITIINHHYKYQLLQSSIIAITNHYNHQSLQLSIIMLIDHVISLHP